MGITEIITISIGLAMDSCTMAIYLGMYSKENKLQKNLLVGFIFGAFQALMPILGFIFGSTFAHLIEKISHWISFFILSFIGITMIKESCENKQITFLNVLKIKDIIILAIVTSIDALAVGITFAFLKINIILACFSIFLTTFILSIIGIKIGNLIKYKLSNVNKQSLSLIGGLILIIVGTKILIKHI